jgi:capsular polysaccharide biosynthesis protein
MPDGAAPEPRVRTERVRVLRSAPWLEAAEAHRLPILSEAERSEMWMCFAPELVHLEEVRLIPRDWLLLAPHGLLIESLDPMMPLKPAKAAHISAYAKGEATLELPEGERTIEEPCVLLGNHSSHYHWLLYHLPRLIALERVAELRDLRLIVGDNILPQQLESLGMLGIGAARLLRLPADAVYLCKSLWVPPALTDRMHAHPAALRWLRRAFTGSESPRPRGGRVLTSRRDAPIRHLVNEEEVAEALAPLGFRLARCGALGFAEQVRFFSEAQAVVGGTGSALSNAVFVPSGSLMMELHNYQGALFLDFLCMQLGQYYERVIGELRPQAPGTKLHNCDFYVSPELLRQRLAAAGIR